MDEDIKVGCLVGVTNRVGSKEGKSDGFTEFTQVGPIDDLVEEIIEDVRVGIVVVETDGFTVEIIGLIVGLEVVDNETKVFDGTNEGKFVRIADVGEQLGELVCELDFEIGTVDGTIVGYLLGINEGTKVGIVKVGTLVGTVDGELDCSGTLGTALGFKVTNGGVVTLLDVGKVDGTTVGYLLGLSDGTKVGIRIVGEMLVKVDGELDGDGDGKEEALLVTKVGTDGIMVGTLPGGFVGSIVEEWLGEVVGEFNWRGRVGILVGVISGDVVIYKEGMIVGLFDGVYDGILVGIIVGLAVDNIEGNMDSSGIAVGITVINEGIVVPIDVVYEDGTTVAFNEGKYDGALVGIITGRVVGTGVGLLVLGTVVGDLVGIIEGFTVGESEVGELLGEIEGCSGAMLGYVEGLKVKTEGAIVLIEVLKIDGTIVGVLVGIVDGIIVGRNVGMVETGVRLDSVVGMLDGILLGRNVNTIEGKVVGKRVLLNVGRAFVGRIVDGTVLGFLVGFPVGLKVGIDGLRVTTIVTGLNDG